MSIAFVDRINQHDSDEEFRGNMIRENQAVLLVGATALATDAQSWIIIRLAEAHKGNATPTEIVLFDKKDSPLVLKNLCRYLGGGGDLRANACIIIYENSKSSSAPGKAAFNEKKSQSITTFAT